MVMTWSEAVLLLLALAISYCIGLVICVIRDLWQNSRQRYEEDEREEDILLWLRETLKMSAEWTHWLEDNRHWVGVQGDKNGSGTTPNFDTRLNRSAVVATAIPMQHKALMERGRNGLRERPPKQKQLDMVSHSQRQEQISKKEANRKKGEEQQNNKHARLQPGSRAENELTHQEVNALHEQRKMFEQAELDYQRQEEQVKGQRLVTIANGEPPIQTPRMLSCEIGSELLADLKSIDQPWIFACRQSSDKSDEKLIADIKSHDEKSPPSHGSFSNDRDDEPATAVKPNRNTSSYEAVKESSRTYEEHHKDVEQLETTTDHSKSSLLLQQEPKQEQKSDLAATELSYSATDWTFRNFGNSILFNISLDISPKPKSKKGSTNTGEFIFVSSQIDTLDKLKSMIRDYFEQDIRNCQPMCRFAVLTGYTISHTDDRDIGPPMVLRPDQLPAATPNLHIDRQNFVYEEPCRQSLSGPLCRYEECLGSVSRRISQVGAYPRHVDSSGNEADELPSMLVTVDCCCIELELPAKESDREGVIDLQETV